MVTYRRVSFAEAASVLGPDLGQRRLGDVSPLFSVVQLVHGLPVLGQVHVGLLLLQRQERIGQTTLLRCGSELVHGGCGSGDGGDARPPPLVSCRLSSCSAASPPAPASSAGSSGPPPTGTAAPLAGARSSAASSPSRRVASAPSRAPAPAPSPERGGDGRGQETVSHSCSTPASPALRVVGDAGDYHSCLLQPGLDRSAAHCRRHIQYTHNHSPSHSQLWSAMIMD